jgi:hypothetical protein
MEIIIMHKLNFYCGTLYMKDSIIADLKDNYKIICNQITLGTGGWLNQKWKISTDKCDLLVKQFTNINNSAIGLVWRKYARRHEMWTKWILFHSKMNIVMI